MKYLNASLLVLSLAAWGSLSAGDISELTAQCDDCHGPAGASTNSDVPIIGGQSAKYISDSLKSFQNWGRPCVKSVYRFGDTSRPRTDMCKLTAGLSMEDITDLAAHYSKLPWVAAQQPFDEALAASGAPLQQENCESCHQQGGTVAGRGPVLAGQWTPYLKATLKFVPTGEHLVPHAMEREVTDLSAEDINAIMNFYASQQN